MVSIIINSGFCFISVNLLNELWRNFLSSNSWDQEAVNEFRPHLGFSSSRNAAPRTWCFRKHTGRRAAAKDTRKETNFNKRLKPKHGLVWQLRIPGSHRHKQSALPPTPCQLFAMGLHSGALLEACGEPEEPPFGVTGMRMTASCPWGREGKPVSSFHTKKRPSATRGLVLSLPLVHGPRKRLAVVGELRSHQMLEGDRKPTCDQDSAQIQTRGRLPVREGQKTCSHL